MLSLFPLALPIGTTIPRQGLLKPSYGPSDNQGTKLPPTVITEARPTPLRFWSACEALSQGRRESRPARYGGTLARIAAPHRCADTARLRDAILSHVVRDLGMRYGRFGAYKGPCLRAITRYGSDKSIGPSMGSRADRTSLSCAGLTGSLLLCFLGIVRLVLCGRQISGAAINNWVRA